MTNDFRVAEGSRDEVRGQLIENPLRQFAKPGLKLRQDESRVVNVLDAASKEVIHSAER